MRRSKGSEFFLEHEFITNKVMAQYIDKATLVAEIERRRDRITKGIFCIPLTGRDRADATFEYEILGKIKEFLNTLEVKEVKEPSASDRGTAEEIIISLKQIENDYHIDHTKEIEWVRSKAQKGE